MFSLLQLHRMCTSLLEELSLLTCPVIIAGSLESAYSLIWGSHEIWGKGGRDTLALL